MNSLVLNLLLPGVAGILLYLLAGGLLWQRLLGGAEARQAARSRPLLVGLVAVVLHGIMLGQLLWTDAGLDVGFYTIFTLVGWLVALLLLLSAFTRPVESLGIMVLPFTALTVLLRLLSDEHQHLSHTLTPGLEFHILISILAYSLLSIAVVQAILLYFQEAHLHNKQPGGILRALPPLETMETMLFQMIGLGFIVLSISLISGGFYLEDLFAQQLVHKTVLSIIAWILFAILLWGRVQFGWRGRVAIRWTIAAFIALMLAYFGSKFVIELVLNQ
ncbi:cytochrome C assembly family protein [Thiohalophilus sp.]|uniref:cytochrome C assembly family protein n=1 Tax=Thiohalophilus sp. TaxID=3028392 RepID=UPI002ACE61CC|nr:cytochrome c biogenesis protein CcsA [Thiohalophilus sp.]MDZ7662485.1 cytochrome c biogenesis protein CcsA [Thiohalophilus sp.]